MYQELTGNHLEIRIALARGDTMFKKIGLKIRRVRLSQNIKQKDLARMLGLTEGRVSQILNQPGNMTLANMVKIARRSLSAPPRRPPPGSFLYVLYSLLQTPLPS